MIIRSVLAALLLAIAVSQAAAETSRLDCVTEYIRELGANEAARAAGERDMAEAGGDKFSAMIRSSTRLILELNAEIGALKRMPLDGQFADVPETITALYQQKIAIHQQIIDMATEFMSGPKPNVDYGAMTAKAPQLTATLEYIDRTLFKVTPLIFAMLIADKPDSQGHMSACALRERSGISYCGRCKYTSARKWMLTIKITPLARQRS